MTAYFSNAKTYCYGKAKGRLNTRDLTSRDWTTRHHIARVDIARLISVFVLMIRKNNIMFERQVPTDKKTCRRRRLTYGMMTTVGLRNETYEHTNAQQHVSDLYLTPVFLQCRHGARNSVSTSVSFVRSSPHSGARASTPTDKNQVVCGDRSTSCWDVSYTSVGH